MKLINVRRERFSENNLYKNRYRVESARLKNWDYSANGYYYITICTKDRIHYFGNIINDEMILSKIGNMAYKYWQEIPNHFPFVRLDEFVIMPNHVHGIVIIDNATFEDATIVETQNLASLQMPSSPCAKFGRQSKNIASIIRGFKIGVTKYATNNNISFKWQPRFYDHIIRNEKELENMRNYIFYNPQKWAEDDYYK